MKDLSPNALKILQERYFLRDTEGQVIEDAETLFRRVAHVISRGNKSHEADFFQLLSERRFLPNTPTLTNAGKPKGQLSACFVLPIANTLEAIFETLKHAAMIHQSGGGTGFSFSHVHRYSAVGVMEIFNASTNVIQQSGLRRGANMAILNIDHPEIEAFIHFKQNLSKLTHFNVSVGITPEFIEALKAEAPFHLKNPETLASVKIVSARALFEQLVECAWKTGEPGLVFLDRLNWDNLTPHLGQIESTNPCGEVPLLPYEACNLGSLNVGLFVNEKRSDFDWEALKIAVKISTVFLDNVIEANHYPTNEIASMVKQTRKIGLGVMGWADALMALDIAYNSTQAITLAQDLMSFILFHSKWTSVDLAKQDGPFPACAESLLITHPDWHTQRFGQHATRLISIEDWQQLDAAIAEHGIRHATTTSLAPTGTISIIAEASGGIEPLFDLSFERHVLDGQKLQQDNRFVQEALARGSAAVMSAHEISPESHLLMQEAFQQFCDNAVSKTINLKKTAPLEAVTEIYKLAMTLEVKGITVYRSESRQNQPMQALNCPTC
jgi:ribonucleoside-diphosphate reductase alpha chain